ncbi:hypothetical protein BKA56DRAFT_728961 [Ilyonectria sp. MPI-CAGE-AT-0026]|nr:hypothetical protein BKA56DRAFT_728961 [Ilyonectria sp. MPI-CAGE-AT-0026]
MRTSCDRCVRLKKGCNSEFPCETCASKGEACSYMNIQGPQIFTNEHDIQLQSPVIEETHDSNEYSPMPDLGISDEANGDNVLKNTVSATELHGGQDTRDMFWWSSGFTSSMPLMNEPTTRLESLMSLEANNFATTLEQPSYRLGGPFEYLVSLTRGNGLATCFDCAHASSNWDSMCIDPDETWNSITFDLTLTQGTFEGAENAQVPLEEQPSILHSQDFSTPASIEWISKPMAMKTNEIVDSIKGVLCNKRPTSTVTLNWSSLLQQMSIKMFSPPQISHRLDTFWYLWYPNCPILHKPTFSILEARSGLISSMLLIGSCLSSDEDERSSAKIWFDCVEEMVFEDPGLYAEFVPEIDPSDCTKILKQRIQPLQAAYFICLLQNWEGSKKSARRIRTHRYNTVVQAAKELAKWITAHDGIWGEVLQFNWVDFAVREQALRTVTYIFLLDNAFVMFDNCLMRFSVQDLKIKLPCPDAVFEAETSEECFVEFITADAGSKTSDLSISYVVESLCQLNTKNLEHLGNITGLSALNLFTLLTGLQSLMLQSRGLIGLGMQLLPIHCGLSNWRRAWAQVSTRTEFQATYNTSMMTWKRVGFIRHALESWTLAKMILDEVDAVGPSPSHKSNFNISASEIIASYSSEKAFS